MTMILPDNKPRLRKKPGDGAQVTAIFMVNGRPVCQAAYRMPPGTQSIELPFPVRRLNA